MGIKEFYEKHKGKIVRDPRGNKGRLIGYWDPRYVIEDHNGRTMSDIDRESWNICPSLGPVKHGTTSVSVTLVEVDSQLVEIAIDNSKSDRFPHICSLCGSPAYIGFSMVECSKACK